MVSSRLPANVALLCFLAATLGHAGGLPSSVAQALKAAQLPASALGVAVLPVDGGVPAWEHRAEQAMNPASTMKLLTTYAALELLGPAFQWQTSLWTDGKLEGDTLRGNLYVKGGGDPKLTFDQYWLLLRGLRNRGVRKISGDLVLDRSYFKQLPDLTAVAFDDRAERAYNVAPDSLLVNFKAVRFEMDSDDKSISVRAEPSLPGVTVTHRFKLASNISCETWQAGWQKPDIEVNGGSATVILQGSFPKHCRGNRYLGLFDHAVFVDKLTRGLWAELGGELSGNTREATVPANALSLTSQASPALAEVIRDINKWSNNTMARSVYLTLGAEKGLGEPTSAQAAEQVIKRWLGEQKLIVPELVLENGSGLSRIERISPRHLADLLLAAWRSPYAAEFTASMPIMGIDGTMRKRFANTPLAGQGHIKTGTLDDVRSIAGYVRASNGKTYAVVAFINHANAERGAQVLNSVLEAAWQGTLVDSAAAKLATR